MENLSIAQLDEMGIKANAPLSQNDLKRAKEIILTLQRNAKNAIQDGYGPFFAAIYDKNGKLIAQRSNSVVNDLCSLYHAEINTIEETSEQLEAYDLSPFDLTMYVTAEPCMMCKGAIMWSGIKRVFFGVPSSRVEEITGFDEGICSDWFQEFGCRNIKVYGNICVPQGEEVLNEYMSNGYDVYMPDR